MTATNVACPPAFVQNSPLPTTSRTLPLFLPRCPSRQAPRSAADEATAAAAPAAAAKQPRRSKRRTSSVSSSNGTPPPELEPGFCTVSKVPLPHILVVHCGGTFGMDAAKSFDSSGRVRAGGTYKSALRAGGLLSDLLRHFPELASIANLDVTVAMNLDSARVGPSHWMKLARVLHKNRSRYDGFVVIHGTDTMSYTGSALSLMLPGFGRPVILTGSQLPMAMPRSDARQNLVDSVTVACAGVLQEVAICFGGTLLRANRAQKTSSSAYRAFSSPSYPPLATLGVDIEWNQNALWEDPGVYRPRIKLDSRVVRIPAVPGVDPRMGYGDLFERGVRGAVIESFGVGNLPDQKSSGWMDWLKLQRKKGLEVYLASQCLTGPINPELYKSGSMAIGFGATTTRRMTAETAVVKLMLCLAYTDLNVSYPLAGEL